jgi:hypothetical protein
MQFQTPALSNPAGAAAGALGKFVQPHENATKASTAGM